ncbi:hypothetical protein N7G274_002285 [Stereocaulon virgatum]|uniref:Uncharacterized protein n=1 Tax=Stereocaulon virgatum TaxID=373712 RepID=A0ABR4AP65_9LECA
MFSECLNNNISRGQAAWCACMPAHALNAQPHPLILPSLKNSSTISVSSYTETHVKLSSPTEKQWTSITASVITVLSAAHKAGQGLHKIKALKDAPRELDNLLAKLYETCAPGFSKSTHFYARAHTWLGENTSGCQGEVR